MKFDFYKHLSQAEHDKAAAYEYAEKRLTELEDKFKKQQLIEELKAINFKLMSPHDQALTLKLKKLNELFKRSHNSIS